MRVCWDYKVITRKLQKYCHKLSQLSFSWQRHFLELANPLLSIFVLCETYNIVT